MNPFLLHIVERGGIFLRTILLAFIILLVAYIIKTDLSEGTLSYAAFYNEEESCGEDFTEATVSVQVHEGDTLQSLFALHPSSADMSFLEQLAIFYKLNPHLRKQALVAGDIVTLPIFEQSEKQCQ